MIWDAKKYKQNSSPQQRVALEALEKHSFTSNNSILDIGCGTGEVTAYIASLAPHGNVTGIDISHDMILQARQTFPQTENKNVHFELLDAEKITYQEEFDTITSFNVLHWLINLKEGISKIAHALKKGGTFISIMNYQDPLLPLAQAIYQTSTSAKWGHNKHAEEINGIPETIPVAQDVKRYTEEAGLSVNHFSAQTWVDTMANYNDFFSFVDVIISHTYGHWIDSDKQEAFAHDICENYLKLTKQNRNKTISVSFPILYLVAKK